MRFYVLTKLNITNLCVFTNHVLHTLYLVVRVVTCFVIYGHKTQVVTNENHYLFIIIANCVSQQRKYICFNKSILYFCIYLCIKSNDKLNKPEPHYH